MMGTASFQSPTSGRSRFSKALPAPPPLVQQLPLRGSSLPQQQPPPAPRKQLPATPAPVQPTSSIGPGPNLPLPPLPVPKDKDTGRPKESTMAAAVVKANNLPLPPLPQVEGQTSMAIPRRPVAATNPPSPAEVSPVTSISSILSAYSAHSSAFTQRSSTGESAIDNASTKGASIGSEARVDGERKFMFQDSYSQHTTKPEQNGRPKTSSDAGDLPPPPPPMKDPARANKSPLPNSPSGASFKSMSSTRSGPRPAQSLMDTLLGKPASQPEEQPQVPSQSQAAEPTPAAAAASAPQPQPQQIWRRRSLKADASLNVTELKLAVSHGSTASSTQAGLQDNATSKIVSMKPQLSIELPAPKSNTPTPLPISANAAFSGRNIRPAAACQQPAPTDKAAAEEEAENMGSEQSRIGSKLRKGVDGTALAMAEERDAANKARLAALAKTDKPAPNASHPLSPVARLPTPPSDYGKDEVRSPVIDHIVSPESPTTSPELPPGPKSATIQRKPIAVGVEDRQLRPMNSTPALAPIKADAPLPALPNLRAPIPRSPMGGLPSSPAPNRVAPPATTAATTAPEPSRFPARVSSKSSSFGLRQELAGPEGLQVARQRDQLARPQIDQLKSVSETGSVDSDETVRPKQVNNWNNFNQNQNNIPPVRSSGAEFAATDNSRPATAQSRPATAQEFEPTDNPGAARFPRNWFTPIANGEMLAAAPLEEKHFHCEHSHRTWFPSSQRWNPISCATCGDKDFSRDYWSCGHCHVRVCPSCRMALQRKFRHDLGLLMDDIEQRTIMDMYSTIPEEAETDGPAKAPIAQAGRPVVAA